MLNSTRFRRQSLDLTQRNQDGWGQIQKGVSVIDGFIQDSSQAKKAVTSGGTLLFVCLKISCYRLLLNSILDRVDCFSFHFFFFFNYYWVSSLCSSVLSSACSARFFLYIFLSDVLCCVVLLWYFILYLRIDPPLLEFGFPFLDKFL
ncbi:hypothetical protein ACOSQ4_023434 [Xanthoceras sorbifolium]